MKTLLISTAMIVAATGATAGRYIDKCTTQRTPYTTTETYTIESAPGNDLAGAIIGGAIGSQFGNGSGKDAMTVLGAIVGAQEGAKPRTRTRTVTKYTEQRVCHRVWASSAIPEHRVEDAIYNANDGLLSMESIKDLQFTLGIKDDGVWGRKSRRAARSYLNEINFDGPMIYSLQFNGTTLMSSQDLQELTRVQQTFAAQGITTKVVGE